MCRKLDQFLNQLVDGQDNRAEYISYNQLDKMLDLLIEETKERAIKQISLEATEEGKLLYKKYGFIQMQNE